MGTVWVEGKREGQRGGLGLCVRQAMGKIGVQPETTVVITTVVTAATTTVVIMIVIAAVTVITVVLSVTQSSSKSLKTRSTVRQTSVKKLALIRALWGTTPARML